MKESGQNPWQKHWGKFSYDRDSKREFLTPIFKKLETEGKIGKVVIDVGSGAWSVADFLPRSSDRKNIAVDIAGRNEKAFGAQKLNFDVEKIDQLDGLSYQKALVRSAEFLGIDPRVEQNTEQADTIIFSEILNYVDYQKVIEGFAKFLKPGGRLIIVNMPDRGLKSLFSEDGLKDNNDLYQFLLENNFVIEEKQIPWSSSDESTAMIVLVAQKNGEA